MVQLCAAKKWESELDEAGKGEREWRGVEIGPQKCAREIDYGPRVGGKRRYFAWKRDYKMHHRRGSPGLSGGVTVAVIESLMRCNNHRDG